MSPKSQETCKIRILEKDYVINCSSSERDKLEKSADFLNERIIETRESGSLSGGEKIMVMTALNLVYDFLIAGSDNETNKKVEIDKQGSDEKVTKKLQKLNKKIEHALHQHQQIELT
jgi:cell division protein ZapA (FtsZ GTPase activity inhibitor)